MKHSQLVLIVLITLSFAQEILICTILENSSEVLSFAFLPVNKHRRLSEMKI